VVLAMRDVSGAVLLEQRPASGIWGGLLSLPEFDAEASDAAIAASVSSRYGLQITGLEPLANIRHEFTHYSFLMHPRVTQVARAGAASGAVLRAVHEHEVAELPLPAPIRRLLQQLICIC